ncbi:hypothetical protein SHKM778_52080 [Streptomyces sp. KM77-8]|uniref:SMP-30/Gluconolactonase/LRE-like region domain-containing protein n=1 Tax=Streptomyces haneummycinicus TaxID=3074435 RepID=A0AAT9HNG3_9ACTN
MTRTTAGELLPTRPDRLELGEGIRFTGGRLVLVDLLAGRLLTAPDDPAAPLETLLRLTFPLGAVAPVEGRPGHWIAAAGTGVCLLAPDGTTDWLARPEGDGMRMNDACADPSGRFWAGSMGYDAEDGAGSLHRVDHDGTVHQVLDGITVPNGPAFTPTAATCTSPTVRAGSSAVTRSTPRRARSAPPRCSSRWTTAAPTA